jgi:integrase
LPDLLDVHFQLLGKTRRHVVKIDSARFQGVLPFVSLAVSGRGANIWVVQELMGDADVKATEIYTHVMAKDISVVSSPLDRHIEKTS